MALVRLVLEADPGAPKHRFIGGNAVVGEPLLPPFVARIDPILVGHVVRLEPAAELALDLGNALRARHRRECRLEQPMMLHPLPAALAGANGDVRIAAPQIA